MGIQERRQRERDERRDRIVDAARALFAAHGYEAVTLRRVAEAIEYAPATIYQHFEDKDALLREICHRDFGELSRQTAGYLDVADPVERIARLAHTYIRFAVTHPNHFRLMFMTALPRMEMDAEMLARKGNPERDGYALLRASAAQAIAAGRLGAEYGDADLVAQTLWAAVHGIAALHVTMADDPWIEWRPLEERVRAMIGIVLGGLCREPYRPAAG